MRSICNAIHYLNLKVLFFSDLTEIPATDFFIFWFFLKWGRGLILDSLETNRSIYGTWNKRTEDKVRQDASEGLYNSIIFHLQEWSNILPCEPPTGGGLDCHPSAPSQTVLCLSGSCATCILSKHKLRGTHTIRREPQAPRSQPLV